MDRRAFISMVAFGLVAAPVVGEAQQADKARRIGWLSIRAQTSTAFLQGLHDLGWIEGRNLVIERRYAGNDPSRLPGLAAELVHLHVEIIVAGDSAAIPSARKATQTLPIVMTVTGDPVEQGYVVGLGRPGGNITGLSAVSPELAGKRLELLKESVPRLGRVAVVGPPAHPDWQAMKVATATLGVQLQALTLQSPEEIEGAFQLATRERAGGLIVLPSPRTNNYREKIVALAPRTRLPAVYPIREYVEVGGLMAYGPSLPDMYRRAAGYVDKILKGAKPGDLPVEQPTKFELVINLKTAKALGLTIPQTLLQRADQVIE